MAIMKCERHGTVWPVNVCEHVEEAFFDDRRIENVYHDDVKLDDMTEKLAGFVLCNDCTAIYSAVPADQRAACRGDDYLNLFFSFPTHCSKCVNEWFERHY